MHCNTAVQNLMRIAICLFWDKKCPKLKKNFYVDFVSYATWHGSAESFAHVRRIIKMQKNIRC
jgi:hypothetical protein